MRRDEMDGPGTNMAVPGGRSRATPDTMIDAGLAGSSIGKRVQGEDSENIKG